MFGLKRLLGSAQSLGGYDQPGLLLFLEQNRTLPVQGDDALLPLDLAGRPEA